METSQSPTPEQTDQLLSTLSNQHCRSVLSYFSDTTEESASLDDLATALAHHDPADENQIAIQLHHTMLPRLENTGIVDYDARTTTVRYHGHSQLENWHEYISECEYENNFGEGLWSKSWRRMSMMIPEMTQCGTNTHRTKTAR